MSRALLIGNEPAVALGYTYVQEQPYDAVVIGSLSLGHLLRFQEEKVLSAIAEGSQEVGVKSGSCSVVSVVGKVGERWQFYANVSYLTQGDVLLKCTAYIRCIKLALCEPSVPLFLHVLCNELEGYLFSLKCRDPF